MDYNNWSVNELDAEIERMESTYRHDQLPSIYDEIVARRNELVDPWSPSVPVSL